MQIHESPFQPQLTKSGLAIVEAANFPIRFNSKIENFYQRKKSKSNATPVAFQSFSEKQRSILDEPQMETELTSCWSKR
jgi:hypothetical protein